MNRRSAATGNGIIGKVLIALLSAVFGLVSGYVLQTLGKKEPQLTITISAPSLEFGRDRVLQFITVKNSGNDLSKQVRLVIKSVQTRIYEEELRFESAPEVVTLKPNYNSSGDLSFIVGDLPPGGYLRIQLSYRKPPLIDREIDGYSDNAVPRKLYQTQPSPAA